MRATTLVASSLIHVHSPYPDTDAAEDVVGDCAGHPADLLRIEFQIALLTEKRHFISEPQRLGVAEIDRGQIHRDCAQNRCRFAIRDDLALVGQPGWKSIRIA